MLRRLALGLFALLLACVVGMPFLLLEDEPVVDSVGSLDAARVARLRSLLREYGPGQQHDGDEKTLVLGADELSVLLTTLAHGLDGMARVRIAEETLRARASYRMPANPVGRFLNVEMVLRETGGIPDLDRLVIGRLTVPPALGRSVLRVGLGAAATALGLGEVESMVREVRMRDGAVSVRFEWRDEVANAVRLQFIPADEQARMRAFAERLAEVAGRQHGIVPLPTITAPLFALAAERAQAGGDAVADNRAAMMVLVLYLTGRHARQVLPQAEGWPAAKRLSVRVHRRVDLVEHFMVSAVLAAAGGEAMADALGVGKELGDARSGSGFSFVDLLADTAGTRFGQLATDSTASARKLQRLAAAAVREEDWVPNPRGLREEMTEAEFKSRYGGVEGQGFRDAVADIENRLASSPLYR